MSGQVAGATGGRVFYASFIIGILFIVSILDGGLTVFAAFLKPLAEEFGWTRAQTTAAFSLRTQPRLTRPAAFEPCRSSGYTQSDAIVRITPWTTSPSRYRPPMPS